MMQGDRMIYYIKECPECRSNNLICDYEHGEIVCTRCGYVVDSHLTDLGPEWRSFDNEQKERRARVGAPTTYTIHDKGLSTIIDWHSRDKYGKELDIEQKNEAQRLRLWQQRIRVFNATERNLAQALSELSKIALALNVPKSVLETASLIYRITMKKNLVRGRSIQGIAAASLYIACRRCGVIRTLDDIAKATGLPKKEIGRFYRFIIQGLNIQLPPSSIAHYISKLISQLGLTGKTESLAYKISEEASKMMLTCGRSPVSMAAAIVYISAVVNNEYCTQREIANAARVTEVTIRNRYKELLDNIHIIIKI